MLGTDQERALRSAATAAVECAAGELHPDNEEQAAELARVVDQVFKAPVPSVPLAGEVTVLEGLSPDSQRRAETVRRRTRGRPPSQPKVLTKERGTGRHTAPPDGLFGIRSWPVSRSPRPSLETGWGALLVSEQVVQVYLDLTRTRHVQFVP